MMNRFLLAEIPHFSAQYLCDKHVVKMCLEEAQILSTALFLNGLAHPQLYRPTHLNHPVVKWTARSIENFEFGFSHFKAICAEYTYRYNKVHKSWTKLHQLLWEMHHELPFKGKPDTYPICCTGYETRFPRHAPIEEAVQCYRTYYLEAKKDIATWNKSRPAPLWYLDANSFSAAV